MDEYVKKADVIKVLDTVLECEECALKEKVYSAIQRIEGNLLGSVTANWKYIGDHLHSRLYCCSYCGGLERFGYDVTLPHIVRPHCRCGARMVPVNQRSDGS